MIFPPGNIQAQLKDLASNSVYRVVGTGAPTSGTSGTGVGLCGPGSEYTNKTTGDIYRNTNTKASPTWTIIPGAAASVTAAMLDATTVQVATGTILSAAITGTSAGQLGHANGVALVASGGAHVVTEFISAIIITDFGVAAYTGGGNTGIKISGGGIALSGVVANTVIIQAAADAIEYFNPLAATGLALSENTGINFVTASAPTNPGTAAGVIRWKCTYRQYATGL